MDTADVDEAIELALRLITRARRPWPNVMLAPPTGLPGGEGLEDAVTVESPTEVEAALGCPLNVGLVLNSTRSGNAFAAVWLRRARREDVRGRPISFGVPYVLRVARPERETLSLLTWFRGRWRLADPDPVRRGILGTHGPGGLADQLAQLPGLQLWKRYRWQAKFLTANGHLVVPTDALGAHALFASRTAPVTAGGRRAALLHWVRAHMRASRTGLDHDVRRHLRGVRSFAWHGWQVALEPSASDAEELSVARKDDDVPVHTRTS